MPRAVQFFPSSKPPPVTNRPTRQRIARSIRPAQAIALALFALAAAAILGAGLASFNYFSQRISRDAQENLRAVAELKSAQIEALMHEALRDARLFAQRRPVQDLVAGRVPEAELAQARRRMDRIIEDTIKAYDYQEITVLDSRLRIVAPAAASALAPAESAAVEAALRTRTHTLADLHLGPNGQPDYGIAQPVFQNGDPKAPVLGVVFFELDAAKALFPLVRGWPTSSPSAETSLLRRQGDEILVLTPLRHSPSAPPLSIHFPSSDQTRLGARAIAAHDNLIEAVDSRGIEVLAASYAVAGTPWVIVSKIDRAEIERPLHVLATVIVILVLVLLALAGGISMLLWKGWSRTLRADRALLAAIVDSSSDAIAATDLDTAIVAWNATAERMFGYSADEARGRRISMLAPPELQQEVDRARRALLAGTPISNHEAWGLRKDGRRIDISISAAAIKDEQGTLIGFATIVRDISERKQTENELAKESSRNRAFLRNSSDGTHILDDDGTVLEVSNSFCRMLGYSREELMAANVSKWDAQWSPEDLKRVVKEQIAKPERSVFETRHRRRDGSVIDVEISGNPIELDGQRVLFNSARDITARKHAEQALRASEQRLREAQEIAQLGNYVFDLPADRWTSSAVLDRLFGIDAAYERTMQGWLRLIPRENRAALAAYFSDQVLASGVFDLEYEVVRNDDGARRWVHGLGRIEKSPSGKPLRMVGTITDITLRKRMDAQIRALNDNLETRVRERTNELERANRALDAFAYSISHDLRAPLRAIHGFAGIVANNEAGALSPDSRQLLERVLANARRMEEMVDDLLRVSRTGRGGLKCEPVDLGTLVALVVANQRSAYPQTQVLAEALPTVNCDRGLVLEIFENLIGNAFKYSGKKAAPRIEIGATALDGETVIHVRDNGAGFDMRYADKLFAVFRRLHSSSEFPGTGVGLAIVKRIVELHGGRIWAEAVPDAGASFYFTLGRMA